MKFPKLNIAFDIDGIVANFADPFRIWALEKYGLKFTETGKFNWKPIPEIPKKMLKEIVSEFISYGDPEIYLSDGALVVDYVWCRCQDPVLFVTARDISNAGDAHEWISRNFPWILYTLAITNSGSKKHLFLNDYGSFVEDRRKTAIDLAGRGKIVFMPMRSYNTISGDFRFPVVTPQEWKSILFESTIDLSRGAIILLEETKQIASGMFDHILFK